MDQHVPYQERLKREPDFVVLYEIDPCEELKQSIASQGMRLDFLYEGENPSEDGIHMIWPELLDDNENVITDTTPKKSYQSGKANMWVFDESRREIHANKMKVGTKGFWVRGSFKFAKVEVIKIGSLSEYII